MKALIVHFCVTTLLVALALLAYDRFVARPTRLVGIVDVNEVYRLKEAEFTQQVTKVGSEGDRQKALGMARQFAQRLPLALEELARDCQCLVLVRTAVAGAPPAGIDLTPLLKRKVDLP